MVARTHDRGLQQETSSDNPDEDIHQQHEFTRTNLILRETRELVGEDRRTAQDDPDALNWYGAEMRSGEDMRYLVEEEMGENESDMQYLLEARKTEAREQVLYIHTKMNKHVDRYMARGYIHVKKRERM
jgi:hypothetical protein